LNRTSLPEGLFSFVRTAELGSFAAAAAALGVTPAAVGQTVKRLENQFGVKLINRTTRKMSLTPEGWLLLNRCKKPLAELDEIARLFDESRGVVSGRLRITAPLELGRRHLLPIIADFYSRHPEIEIELDVSDRLRDFVDDPVDLAFRLSRPEDSSLIARPISDLQAVTIASPDYLAKRGEPRHPQDLDSHSCIGYRYPTTGAIYPWSFLINGREQLYTPKCAIVVNDPETSCEAAALGLGILQTGSNYAAPYLVDGQLLVVMEQFVSTTRTIYLCYPSRDHVPLRVRAFIDHALNALGRDRFILSPASASGRRPNEGGANQKLTV
jgi:DNA-binding transcriptional LysR family regulator